MAKQGIWIDRNTFIEFSEGIERPLRQEIATRSASINFYNLGMYLPNPDLVLRKAGKNITVYNELLSDAHVGSCVQSRKAGVKSLKWSIDRGKDTKSSQAQIIEDAFKALDMIRIIEEILNAPLFGYQPLEIMWDNVGKWWLPTDIMGKPQQWFAFDVDNQPRFLTKTNMILGDSLPERKFIFPKHEPTYDNPYGFPLLSRCFWPVTFKKGGYKFWVMFLEKYGMPFLWGKLPRALDKKDYDDLYNALVNMVQDAVGVTPDDGSIQVVENSKSGGSGDHFEKLLTFSNSEISKAIVGQTLTTEVGERGTYAASKTHKDVLDSIVWSDKMLCEQVFNTLIKWIYEYNFASGDMPVFSLWEEEDVDKDMAERDSLLADKPGVRFAQQYFIREYGFKEGDIASVAPAAPSGAPVQFAEGDVHTFPDQARLDDAMDSISPEEIQKQMSGILKPIIELINDGKDYNAVMEELTKTFPDMESAALEEMLARAIFVSELWGRLNAKA